MDVTIALIEFIIDGTIKGDIKWKTYSDHATTCAGKYVYTLSEGRLTACRYLTKSEQTVVVDGDSHQEVKQALEQLNFVVRQENFWKKDLMYEVIDMADQITWTNKNVHKAKNYYGGSTKWIGMTDKFGICIEEFHDQDDNEWVELKVYERGGKMQWRKEYSTWVLAPGQGLDKLVDACEEKIQEEDNA